MIKHRQWTAVRIVSVAAAFGFAGAALLGQAAPQGGAPAGGAAAATLTPYSTPDKTASAGVPDGWKVIQGAKTVIQIRGPNGEAINLGIGAYVKDGPFQAKMQGSPPVTMAMPSSATLQQKFLMLWQALTTGGPHSANVQILSAAAIPIAKTIADCGKFIGTLDGLNGPVTFETVFCTLPVDAGGIFKLVLIDAEVPSSLAKQERATAEAVLASYRVDPAALRQMLMPYNSPPAPAGSGSSDPDALRAQLQRNRNQQRMIDQQFQCYEAGVMREEPEWRLPPYCH
ncbi:MAG TPA: hypothetical protein VKH15_10410 [Candidatus Acidoferrum sp.]|nr:hypothetical protein [Candidatus Acidoferrum sp.]